MAYLPHDNDVSKGQLPAEEDEEHPEAEHEVVGAQVGKVVRQLSVQQRQDVAQRIELAQDALRTHLQKVVPLHKGEERRTVHSLERATT